MKIHVVKLKQTIIGAGITVVGSIGSLSPIPANALTFNFAPAAGTSQLAIDGFTAAGAQWSSLFKDNVTVNIDINFAALGAGTLGEASSQIGLYSYDRVYNAVTRDRTSADDNTAVNSLSKGSAVNLLLNRTANSPYGVGSAIPYLDNNGNANNQTINLTTANAKALGLENNSNNIDASIAFNNTFVWDFNRSDGITAGAFDFVGIATHEIGHALGFMSGVDILDRTGAPNYEPEDRLDYVSMLDLFRYSNDSKNVNAIDWTADKREKYFSLDGGNTKIAAFSTGEIFGDGRQNSHWQDNLGLGILDPTIAAGESLQISENDRRALDAIGWDRTVSNTLVSAGMTSDLSSITTIARAEATNVPEPSNLIGTMILTAFGIKMVLKRRQQLSGAVVDANAIE
ncbi:NF038122 family metalloprotease [Chamaesiphon sp. OTE_20_metabat_361]|uniref:NF038122 family metalloprotease n=1 Tax=Chamaesiphon sp. OTE_20_metabat_361 TaxID=2964689 RepID=UPI00286B93B5|nr:NF038122 family metalloprotease [Chamaesiphon sp. OTE_20_metabat_361]